MQRNRAADLVKNGFTIAAVWVLYSLVRSVTVGTDQVAHENAELVRAFQESIGLAIEPALQQMFLTEIVGLFANTYYLVHFPATALLLVVTFFRSRDHLFPILRDSLVVMTLVGLVVHALFPLAPPRMLDGIVDASLLYGPNPYELPFSSAANQLAAMPSMHVAWSISLAWALFHLEGRPVLWTFGVLHPVLTFFVVIITGHHFVADVVIGSIVAVAALALVTAFRRDSMPSRGSEPDSVHSLSTG